MKSFFSLVLISLVLLFSGCSAAGDAPPAEWKSIDYSDVSAETFNPDITNPNPPGSVVAQNGALSISGSQLINEFGDPVQLRGMSAFWINWDTGKKYANADVIEHLADDWGVSVYRLAVGVEPTGAYSDNAAEMISIATEVIDACIEQGIYVIVDWHAHDTLDYGVEEGEFFKGIAETYGDYPNVLYELWNEPIEQSWGAEVKPYCENLINNAIRPIDSDNIIIVGNPTWSQDVDQCALSPISGTNIMYSMHFYAKSHGSWLRQRTESAMNSGIAIFVTEWGTTMSDGGQNGEWYETESQEWVDWMNDNNISWVNWSVADKDEASAVLKPGASVDGIWTDSELTESGLYIKGQIAAE